MSTEKDFMDMVIPLFIQSIEANAFSLRKQLEEYDWLKVTTEQWLQLSRIERELRDLVQEITNKKPE